MKLLDETNTTTLFQFTDAEDVSTGTAYAVILNDGSLTETHEYETETKTRYGQRSIVKRVACRKNKEFPLKILFLGSARDTLVDDFLTVLEEQEFVYFDTEAFQTRLDGVYAPTGKATQKKNEVEETITVTIKLVEKEA